MRIDRRQFLAGVIAAIPAAHAAKYEEAADPLLDRLFLAEVRADPFRAAQLGIADQGGKSWTRWTIRDQSWQDDAVRSAQASIAAVRGSAHVSVFDRQLFCFLQTERIERARWSRNDYIFYSGNMPAASGMSALIEWQPAATPEEIEAYIARVGALPRWIAADVAIMRGRAAAGVVPPAFNFPLMDAACERMLAQLADPASHPLVADMCGKARAANHSGSGLARARRELETILAHCVRPAIEAFRDALRDIARTARFDRGVWHLPDGEAYYASLVRSHTTLRLAPSDLHRYGLEEVARLRAELRMLAPSLGLAFDEAAVLEVLGTDTRFFLPDTPEGRHAYFGRAKIIVDAAMKKVPDMITLPLRAALEVREVDPVSAPAAGRAFYIEPRADGAPGAFFVNTHDMRQNPSYQLEAIVHHEAVPGHHLQAAVQAGLHVPLYRRQLYIGAFAEGWGLYAEKLADEFGLYTSPAARAGRIALELFRAARLVVDTGIHANRWSLDAAIDYMNANTANARPDNVREVQRYFNWPGQALSYKVGMRQIEQLRAATQAAEGIRFDVRRFHDRILEKGSRPLGML